MNKKINIEGMMCAHCVAHVEKALNAIPGVHARRISRRSAPRFRWIRMCPTRCSPPR